MKPAHCEFRAKLRGPGNRRNGTSRYAEWRSLGPRNRRANLRSGDSAILIRGQRRCNCAGLLTPRGLGSERRHTTLHRPVPLERIMSAPIRSDADKGAITVAVGHG